MPLDVIDDKIKDGLRTSFLQFKKNVTDFWDSYRIAHPENEDSLILNIWDHYLSGLKAGAQSQEKLGTVKEANATGGEHIESPDFKSVMAVESKKHPMLS